jgi:hypothetical protein
VARNDGPSHSLKRQPDPRFGESASTRLRNPAGNQCSGAPGREPRRPEVEFDGVLSGPPSRLPGAGCCRAGPRPLRERGRRPGGRPEDAPGASAAGRGPARWPGRWWRPGLAKAAGRAGTGCRGRAGPGAAGAAGGSPKEAEISASNSASSHCGSSQIRSANAASASRVDRVMPITLPGTSAVASPGQ